MGLYRKRPTDFEASRWFKLGDHDAVLPVPEGHLFRRKGVECESYGWVPSGDSGHIVVSGDWIAKGVHGFFPLNHEIFEATYEYVGENDG